MKKILVFLACLLFVPMIAGGQVINSFDAAPADTNYWAWFNPVNATSTHAAHFQTNTNADSALGWIHISYVNDPVKIGSGAMQLEYSVHNAESWGGYSKLEHWHPDPNAVYDWSAYDSISFWYYNLVPQSLPSRVTFRLCLHDVSNSPNGNATYTVGQSEYYYSFLSILDNQPGWHEVKMPLIRNDSWTGEGFNLTLWAGIGGNGKLDKDKIKGFSLEFSISGGGQGDYATGTIVLDHLALKGLRAIPFVIFTGMSIPNNLTIFTWGQSSLEVEEGAGAIAGTNALKWVQGNGWTGAGVNVNPPINLAEAWLTDSLKFKMKAETGTGTMRLQFEGGTGKKGYVFNPIADGAWHDYAFKLTDFVYQDGTSNFDSSAITVFQFMAEGTGIAGKTIYFDHIWTGNPEIDIISPEPPTGVNAVARDYYNLVIWRDVPGESGESYDVYASTKPITTLTAPDVDIIATKVAENIQSAVHWIYYPLVDKNVEYYYAVTCKDKAGNISKTFGASPTAITNKAKGIATISLNPPANFAADGDFSEWDASGIMPFDLSPTTGYIPVGTIDDDADLSANVYLAIDDDYLYIAIDVVDNVYHYGAGNWWDQDAFQLFIGFYDWRGPKHASLLRGNEPDYILYLTENVLQLDNPTGTPIYTPDSPDYHFEGLNPDYLAEAKIPLDILATRGNDRRFHPLRGMRIPIDLYFHDNDGAGWEGNLSFSPWSTDHQWQYPTEWAYTWIGDTTHVAAVDEATEPLVLNSYSLAQNYPNPFNSTTTIHYSLAKEGLVKIEVFNPLGQKMRTLVQGRQPAGRYTVDFNAEDLPSGLYFYRIQAGSFTQTRKMILIK